MLRAAATSDTPEQPDMHRLRLDGGPWPRAAGFPAATGFALEYTNPGAHMCLGAMRRARIRRFVGGRAERSSGRVDPFSRVRAPANARRSRTAAFGSAKERNVALVFFAAQVHPATPPAANASELRACRAAAAAAAAGTTKAASAGSPAADGGPRPPGRAAAPSPDDGDPRPAYPLLASVPLALWLARRVPIAAYYHSRDPHGVYMCNVNVPRSDGSAGGENPLKGAETGGETGAEEGWPLLQELARACAAPHVAPGARVQVGCGPDEFGPCGCGPYGRLALGRSPRTGNDREHFAIPPALARLVPFPGIYLPPSRDWSPLPPSRDWSPLPVYTSRPRATGPLFRPRATGPLSRYTPLRAGRSDELVNSESPLRTNDAEGQGLGTRHFVVAAAGPRYRLSCIFVSFV
eukprot:1186955-Prorocentrum_minimum.AAC.1